MDRASNNSTVASVRAALEPELRRLLAELETSGNRQGLAFFQTVALGLERAGDDGALAELFVHLSTVAFIGIDFAPAEARQMDRVLAVAEQFAQMFAADTGHRH